MRLRGKLSTAGLLAAAFFDRTRCNASASNARHPWRVVVGRMNLAAVCVGIARIALPSVSKGRSSASNSNTGGAAAKAAGVAQDSACRLDGCAARRRRVAREYSRATRRESRARHNPRAVRYSRVQWKDVGSVRRRSPHAYSRLAAQATARIDQLQKNAANPSVRLAAYVPVEQQTSPGLGCRTPPSTDVLVGSKRPEGSSGIRRPAAEAVSDDVSDDAPGERSRPGT